MAGFMKRRKGKKGKEERVEGGTSFELSLSPVLITFTYMDLWNSRTGIDFETIYQIFLFYRNN